MAYYDDNLSGMMLLHPGYASTCKRRSTISCPGYMKGIKSWSWAAGMDG